MGDDIIAGLMFAILIGAMARLMQATHPAIISIVTGVGVFLVRLQMRCKQKSTKE
jgi:hypothetical protein